MKIFEAKKETKKSRTIKNASMSVLSRLGESKKLNEEDKRLSFTSTKYKGYRISLDQKYGCYNIYDSHGELEDSGFKSVDQAKKAIDSLNNENFNKHNIYNEDYWRVSTKTDQILDNCLAYLRWTKGDEDFIDFARKHLGMTDEDLKYYCDFEEEDLK